jgi:hypothetical protein
MGGKTLDQFRAIEKAKAAKGAKTGSSDKGTEKQGSAPYTLGAHRENSD